MTVSSSTNRVSYAGNGSTTVFPYTYKIFDEDDLTVILRAANGTETVQTITSDYTVSGVGNAGGGNVTMLTAPATGETLVVLREQDLVQELDIVPNDPFPADSLEAALDKLTFMVQQHKEELDRALKVSRTNTISTVEFTEAPATRANKFLGFDASGDLFVASTTGGGVIVSSYMQDFLLTSSSIAAFAYLGVTSTAAELNTLDGINTAGNFGLVPSGGIIMWSGSVATIPSGWFLCDGTNGTPDLTGRFVVHADADSGGTYAPGDTGGANDVTLNSSQIPSHTHTFSGTTNTTGAHTHTVAAGNSGGVDNIITTGNARANDTSYTTSSAGDHSHTFSGTTASTGGGGSHENRPPYYALAYIMKA